MARVAAAWRGIDSESIAIDRGVPSAVRTAERRAASGSVVAAVHPRGLGPAGRLMQTASSPSIREARMSDVALVVIYNHQYNRNIDIVERIHARRFGAIFHVVPFYNGSRPNVIAVHESSHFFQGYIAQALPRIDNGRFKHFLFVADDLILNPAIDETNYTHHFGIDSGSSFFPEFTPLHRSQPYWERLAEACAWRMKSPGVEASGQLPSVMVARERFAQAGLEMHALQAEHIWRKPSLRELVWRLRQRDFEGLLEGLLIRRKIAEGLSFELQYPLVGGYSDLFVLDRHAAREFCHLSGVFAATRLFVELAIPTALVLSARRIVTQRDIRLGGRALWREDVPPPGPVGSDSHGSIDELDRFGGQLDALLKAFPQDRLYLHPIKLSAWDVTTHEERHRDHIDLRADRSGALVLPTI